jgi:riboflavin biosynthesis pyrimidine reductase
MRQIFPASGGADLTDADLAERYAFPAQRWTRVNMVESADGAATAAGASAGLSSAADRRLFAVLRGLAGVILAGAGTARAEGYQPVRPGEIWRDLRAGRTRTPPIAVVSATLDLDPGSALFTQAPADARTIVITSERAPVHKLAALSEHADIIIAGDAEVDLKAALDGLSDRGLGQVSCEGGPRLLASLAAAGLLDELDLTISPLLAGPGAGRIIAGAGFDPPKMDLAHVLHEDGFLFCRYTLPGR